MDLKEILKQKQQNQFKGKQSQQKQPVFNNKPTKRVAGRGR